jgi:hypothetical protein
MPAGFWIPWEIGLPRKREVLLIARKLGVSQREAAVMCMEVWEWAEGQSVDGVMPGLTIDDIDVATGVRGLGKAMADAGWVFHTGSALQFPNWERFNSKSGKARLLNQERQRRLRASRCNA